MTERTGWIILEVEFATWVLQAADGVGSTSG